MPAYAQSAQYPAVAGWAGWKPALQFLSCSLNRLNEGLDNPPCGSSASLSGDAAEDWNGGQDALMCELSARMYRRFGRTIRQLRAGSYKTR